MTVVDFDELKSHLGHEIVCVVYGLHSGDANACIECETCGEVLYEEFENPEDDE